MALPNRIEKTSPSDSDNPSAGAAQIRNLKGFLEDLFGVLDTQTYTAKAFDMGLAGQVTVAQPRLLFQDGGPTIPSLAFSGATGSGLSYDSANSALGFLVGATQVARLSQSGLYVATGVTGMVLGMVDLASYAMGGTGTSGDPWTGWEASLDAFPQYSVVVARPGYYYAANHVSLVSNTRYEFGVATFVPGPVCTGQQMFLASGITNFWVNGGRYRAAADSAMTVETTGTYLNHPAFHCVNSSYFRFTNGDYSAWWADIDCYDCSHYWLDHNTSLNSNASLVALSNTASVSDVHVTDNKIIGCGDDGIFVGGKGAAASTVKDVFVSRNYIDKTRVGYTPAAIGIRVGNYESAVGVLSAIHVTENIMRDMVTNGIIAFDVASGNFSDNIVDGYAATAATAYLFGLDTGRTFTGTIHGNVAANPRGNTAYGMSCQYVTKSLITDNVLASSAAVIPTLLVQHSTYNEISGNRLTNAHATDGRCLEESGISDYNTVERNDVTGGTGTSIFVVSGANSVVRGNPGHVSEASGVSGTLSTGQTITHGLSGTPTKVVVTPIGAPGPSGVGVSDIGATTFAVNFSGGGSYIFYWWASLAGSV